MSTQPETEIKETTEGFLGLKRSKEMFHHNKTLNPDSRRHYIFEEQTLLLFFFSVKKKKKAQSSLKALIMFGKR